MQPVPHPATEAFPLLSEDELLALAGDITQRGQIYPIMLDPKGELILDGRNRKRACEIANIEPRYDRLPEGIDPVAYIYSTNITRRHLNVGQQAIALAMLYPAPGAGRGKKDPALNLQGGWKFNRETLRQARHLIEYPDLATRVRDGNLPFDLALKEAQHRSEQAQFARAHTVRLQNEAPDLAARVREGELALPEAVTMLDRRIAEDAQLRERLSECLRYLTEHVAALHGYLGDPAFVDAAGGIGPVVTLAALLSLEEGPHG